MYWADVFGLPEFSLSEPSDGPDIQQEVGHYESSDQYCRVKVVFPIANHYIRYAREEVKLSIRGWKTRNLKTNLMSKQIRAAYSVMLANKMSLHCVLTCA